MTPLSGELPQDVSTSPRPGIDAEARNCRRVLWILASWRIFPTKGPGWKPISHYCGRKQKQLLRPLTTWLLSSRLEIRTSKTAYSRNRYNPAPSFCRLAALRSRTPG